MHVHVLFCLFMISFVWQLTKANLSQLRLKCEEDDFLCMDGTQCVSKSYLCDGDPDCLDHSDEQICVDGHLNCTHPEEFQCHNGECIPRAWVSDGGPPDCEDGSDELDVISYCGSSKDRFLCANEIQCIPGSYLCDSVQQCVDGSDELGCDTACQNHNCSHICRPTPAGPVCKCPSGYSFFNDTVCVDQDECMGEGATYCEQLCINTGGSFHCGCKDGYQLWTDQRSCVGTGNQTEHLQEETVELIVAGTQGIFSVSVQYLDTPMLHSHVLPIHVTGNSQSLLPRDVDALAFDPIRNMLIFHDVMETTIKSMSLQKSSTGISATADLYSDVEQLEGLAVDPVAQNIYWTTYLGFLYVGKLDGSMSLELIKKGLDKPRGIALDTEESYLYLTIWGHNSRIMRCHLDGTKCITLLYLTGDPNYIVIKPVYGSHDSTRSIYWTDSKEDLICSLTDDDTDNPITHIQLENTRINPHPFGLAVTRGAIFYTDLNTHSLHGILRSDVSIVYDLEFDLGSLYDVLAIDKDQKLPSSNGCHDNNGGCSHFCFPMPVGQHICRCPLNKYLGVDKRTCEGFSTVSNEEFSKMTTKTVEEILNHNDEQWKSGHVVTEGKPEKLTPEIEKPDKGERTPDGGSKLWIVGVVLGIVVFVIVVVLVVVVCIKKKRGQELELPRIFRYHKKSEEFDELVPNDILSKADLQNELEYVDCMTGYRPREVSMISADSAFAEARTDASLNSLTAA